MFTGDRHWKPHYRQILVDVFQELCDRHYGNLKIIVGDCPTGVDPVVAEMAKDYGIELHVEEAHWKEYGKRAGPMRNQRMVEMSPDICVAIHRDLQRSRGTRDAYNRAKRAGIRVYHYGVDK